MQSSPHVAPPNPYAACHGGKYREELEASVQQRVVRAWNGANGVAKNGRPIGFGERHVLRCVDFVSIDNVRVFERAAIDLAAGGAFCERFAALSRSRQSLKCAVTTDLAHS